MISTLLAVALLSLKINAQGYYYDYYWRDYTGMVPDDAVPGGLDLNERPTYIGQAYYSGHFLQVARIYPGDKELVASRGSILKTKIYVKILCSNHKDRFRWLPVNGKTLHVTTTNKHVVRGGVENDKFLNVGRIQYQGELVVGRVTGYNMGSAKLYFPWDNAEKNVEDFEVLTYDLESLADRITSYSSGNVTDEIEGTIITE